MDLNCRCRVVAGILVLVCSAMPAAPADSAEKPDQATRATEAAAVSSSPASAPAMRVHDLNDPQYDPPDCPAWAREKAPAWLEPYRGKNGLPALYRSKPGPLSTSTIGIDRYQANHFIVYCDRTAEYLYRQYTPLKVDYVKGTLPTYEQVAAKYTAGCSSETQKAAALLLKALPDVCKHPVMPPCGPPTRADRGLDDEALLQSGSGWCNEQARVFIRLCQVSGIPARMIHLFGQNHTLAEFYADGRWGLADVSFFFLPAGKDGKCLSVAQCHDGGEGQRLYAQAKKKRMLELAEMSDEQLNLPSGEKVAKYRENCRKFDAEALAARKDLIFAVMNYPLPPGNPEPVTRKP